MKILILQDSHDKGVNPRSRIDNYHESILSKLDETIELSLKCDLVIHLGDVWDSYNVSNTVIDDWLDRIESYSVPWKILPANHDMYGGKWNTSQNSALAHVFRRSKTITELKNEELDDCIINAYPYYFCCEDDIKNKGLISKESNKFKIAFTHAFITIKPFHPDVLHVQAKDIKNNHDLTCCSHFHFYFDEVINKTRYLNISSFGRSSIKEQHIPRIAIIDTNTQKIKVIPLKSAKKGEEVFDLTKYAETKGKKKDIKAFLDSLKDVNFQSLEVSEQIVKIGKEQKIEQPVVDYLLKKVGENK